MTDDQVIALIAANLNKKFVTYDWDVNNERWRLIEGEIEDMVKLARKIMREVKRTK